MKQMLTIILMSFLATVAVIKAAPALGEPVKAQNVSVIRTADLDLSTAAGREALDHRLVIAAYELCGSASDVDLAGRNEVRQCRSDVLVKARARSAELASRGETIRIAAAR